LGEKKNKEPVLCPSRREKNGKTQRIYRLREKNYDTPLPLLQKKKKKRETRAIPGEQKGPSGQASAIRPSLRQKNLTLLLPLASEKQHGITGEDQPTS